jgi:hypothetical protein
MTLGGAALARPIVTTGVSTGAWLAAGLPVLIIGLGGRTGGARLFGGLLLLVLYAADLCAVPVSSSNRPWARREPTLGLWIKWQLR